MTHAEKIARWLPPRTGLLGCEIGAGASPIPGLDPAPIYVDCFKTFGAAPNVADYYGHAGALPFHDHSLDYVVASHVLEHVANPVAALAEWVRVVRPGGLLYVIVPNRRAAWDRDRELTPVAHLLDDFVAGTTARDATHIDEFAAHVAPEFFTLNAAAPATTAAAVDATAAPHPDAAPLSPDALAAARADLARGLHETVARGEDINLHFHTFEPENVRALVAALAAPPAARPPAHAAVPRFAWELVDFADGFPAACPNGVLAVLRVHKGWRARADATAFRLRVAAESGPSLSALRAAVLRPDAEPFSAWSVRTPGLGGVR
jgi:hypothetical protein